MGGKTFRYSHKDPVKSAWKLDDAAGVWHPDQGRAGRAYFTSKDDMEATLNIEITDRALARLKTVAEAENISWQDEWLRLQVLPGGCSGLTYQLGWEQALQDDDQVFTYGDLRVAMDRKSYLYMAGTTLDFTDGLEGQGFHFLNPQAARTCACGESFTL